MTTQPKVIDLFEALKNSLERTETQEREHHFIKGDPMQAVNMYPEDRSVAQTAMPRSIALFDFSHAVNVAYNAAGPDSTADIVIGQLRALRASTDRVVLCIDSKPYRRTKLFDGYKAGRKQDPELANIWDRVFELVQNEGFAVARAAGEEADDVMASLARIYVEDYACEDVRLVTSDKDASQCINDHVRWFAPKLGNRDEFEIRDADWCLRKWGGIDWANEKEQKEGPKPSEIPMVLAIMGDTSDRIPGVKGIGVKGAVWLVKKFGTVAKMAEALVEQQQLASTKGKKVPAFWVNFAAGMVDIPKWLALTTVNDDVQLDQHPLKYLEAVEPKNLVEEGSMGDADDSGFSDAWEPDADELAEERATMTAGASDAEYEAAERAQMAAPLPVDPAPPGGVKAPLIGKDPKADEHLRQAAAERQQAKAASSSSSPPRAAEASAAPAVPSSRTTSAPAQTPVAPQVDARDTRTPTPSGRQSESAADPKGAHSTSAEAGSEPAPSPVTASSAHVVPATQGPQRAKPPEDIIRRPEGAIVRLDPPSWALAAQPQSAAELLDIAKVLFNSRCYSQFGSHRGVFAVMSLGRELGIGYAAALEMFHIVGDKPYPKARGLRALAERDPNCEWIMVVSADHRHATIKTKHRAIGVLEYTYTIERAELAGLTTGKNKYNWTHIPQEMLEARATSKAVNRWYPGSTFGLHCAEEAEDFGSTEAA